jgi:3-oxoadipate enol-lactonase
MVTFRLDLGHIGLAVAEDGAGGRPVLLVHGFTGAKENLVPTAQLLAGRGWHAVAPDLRGHGSSDAPAGDDAYRFDVMAGDLVGLADALGWDRFVLVGHSFGGALAQVVALEHPGRVAGLVLAGTFHGPVAGVEPDLVQLGSAIVRSTGLKGLAQAMAARRAAGPRARGAVEQLDAGRAEVRERQLLACSPDMWLALAPMFHTQPDRLDRLAALAVPTHVIVGADDEVMRADCERIAATIPGAGLTVIPDAGHSPHTDRPEAWAAALTGFLETLPAAF